MVYNLKSLQYMKFGFKVHRYDGGYRLQSTLAQIFGLGPECTKISSTVVQQNNAIFKIGVGHETGAVKPLPAAHGETSL
jgi:hypothetical protein